MWYVYHIFSQQAPSSLCAAGDKKADKNIPSTANISYLDVVAYAENLANFELRQERAFECREFVFIDIREKRQSVRIKRYI